MYTIRNLLKLIFVYCPILIVLIGSYFFACKNNEIISDNLYYFTSKFLSEYMETDIKTDKIIIKGTNIIFYNLDIKDQSNKDILTAKKVFVKLTPFSKKQICKSVYIDTANVNIYEKNNKWNFDFIVQKFKTKEYTESKYIGPVVLIVNSNINITSQTYNYKDHLKNVSSRLDFTNKDYANYNINFSSLYANNIKLYAKYNLKSDEIKIKTFGEDFNLSLINQYKQHINDFSPIKKCQFNGIMDFEFNCKILKEQLKDFSIKSNIKELNVNTPYGNLNNTKVIIKGNKQALNYKIKGNLNKANIYSNGYINLKDHNNLQSKIIVKNANIEDYSKILPKEYKSLKGIINTSISLKGNINSPELFGIIKAKNIKYNTYYLKKLNTKFNLKNNTCNFELESNLKNGNIYSYGQINNINIKKLDKITTNSLLSIRGVNLNDYVPYKAKIDGDLSIKGNLINPNIQSNIELSKGIFNLDKTTYKDIDINLSLDYLNNELNIKSGLIKNIENNDIIFKGKIDKKLNCDLNLSVNNIDLCKIAKDYDLNIKGFVSLNSHIIKKDKIQTENLLNLEKFSYNNLEINFAQIDFNANSDKININNCTILDFPATISFSGELGPNKNNFKYNLFNFKSYKNKPIYFNLKLNENNYTIENICKKTNKDLKDINGIIKGNVEISGDFYKNKIENLNGNGEALIENIKLNNFTFNSLETKLTFKDTIIDFYNIKGNVDTYSITQENIFGSIEGEASYDINEGFYKGNLQVKNININDFRDYYKNYINLFGLINFNIDFNGQYKELNAKANGNISRLSINSKSYDTIPISLTLEKSDLINGDFTCRRNNQFIEGNIKDFSISKQHIKNLTLKANNLEVNDLREIFYLSPIAQKPKITTLLKNIPTITEGELEGKLNLSGYIKELNGNCEIKGKNINADFDKINSIDAKLTAKKGVINLDNLSLEGTEFIMTCDAYPLCNNNNTKINLSLVNLPLERFGKYINMKNVKGMLSADAIIEGNLNNPNITSSINIDNPIINNIEMKELQASKISITSQYVDFPQGINLFITDNNLIKLEGKIPLSILKSQTSNEEFTFNLTAPKQDLSVLEKLSPHIIKESTKGILYANANLHGTFEKSQLEGSISIDNGELVTIGNTKINNINAKLNLSNDENNNVIINIDKITSSDDNLKNESFKINDGYIKIYNSSLESDTIDFNKIFKESEIKLSAKLDNYYYKSHDFSTYQDKTFTNITGEIKIDGNLLEPKIYTENPIILSNLACTFKTNTSNNELLEKLTNQTNDNKFFYYRDASDYDEIKITRNRDKKLIFNPSFDIKITTQKADIKPPATYVKANGDVNILGDLNNPIINGEIIALEGKCNFQIARARIVKNSKLDFTVTNNGINGNIDAQAFSYVHYNDKNGQDQRYKINILIDGNINDPNIELVSDPDGLTTKEILMAFTGFTNNEIDARGTLAKIGANTILSPIEDVFVEYLGFDSLGFEYKQDNYAIINIEKSFDNKFYGSFYSNLYNKSKNTTMSSTNNTDLALWELKLGYRFNSRLKFDIGTNSKKEQTVNFNYGFRF